MTDHCPDELTLSMHADRELPATDAVAMELHLAGCSKCRMRLAALRSETSIVAAALVHDAELVTTPAYRRPVSRLAMAATAAGGLLVALLVAVIPNLITGLLSGPIQWFNPFDSGTIADLGVEAAIFLVKNGGVIMASIAKTVAIAGFTTLLGWLTFARRARNRAHGPLLLAGLLGLLALQPMPSQALEIRHDKNAVFIPAGETIDDTLIVSGETVEVAGNVTGDLIAVGRRITIRGHVGGQVFAFAQTVNVDGDVGGSVTSAAETLSVSAPHIGGNLYGAGSTVNLNSAARVDSNAIVAGDLQLAGSVGRDVLAAGENVDTSGAIGGALTAYAQALKVLAPARIAGNVTAYVQHAKDVTVSSGAVIGGKLETNLIEGHVQTNRYLTGAFYLSQLLRFVAALITGAVVLALLPGLRSIAIDDARDVLIAGGVGMVTLIATPIIAVIVAITIIGLPIGILGLLLWMVGLYLAKLVVANFIGTRLNADRDEPRHFIVTLAVGLAIVIVAINLPLIGGVLSFILTIVGLGLLVLLGWRGYSGGASSYD